MEEHKIPTLTLTPDLDAAQPAAKEPDLLQKAEAAPEAGPDLSMLSPEEQQAVTAFAGQIDLTNANQVLQYGSAAQKNIADFSDTALAKVKTGDLGEIGTMLSGLLVELKTMDEPEKKGIAGWFAKANKSIEETKAKYSIAEKNVDKIAGELENHKLKLMKDVAVLDQLYNVNLANFKELSMYIVAGKQKLEEVRANELPALIEKAKQSNLPEDTQAANDMAAMCNRFEKKIHDLELTRAISIQMAPQIRLIQNNDTVMVEKIQTTLVNTIPLWKNQMVLALGLAHSQQAMQAERAVTDMTNDLLKKNAEALKLGTIETAKESQRGVVDIETLQQTNKSLIETLDELNKIQNEGRAKRAAAEQELNRIEDELKAKMMEIRS